MIRSDRRRAFGIWFWAALLLYLLLYMSNLQTALLDMEGDPLMFFEYSRAMGYTPLLMPLVAAAPCGASLCTDLNSGYWIYCVQRAGRKRYLRSRFLCCTLSGGAAALGGTALFLAFLILRYPADLGQVSPWVDVSFARGILRGGGISRVATFWTGILMLQFLGGAFWAASAMAFSAFCPNGALTLCAPLVIYRLVDEIGGAVAFYAFLSPVKLVEAIAGLDFWPTMLAGATVLPAYTAAMYGLLWLGMKRRWSRA